MKFVLTPQQMREADSRAINEFNIKSLVLMENAAHSSALFIKKIFSEKFSKKPKVSILCGSGNNGGDGFAIARHLMDDCSINIYWIGAEEKMSAETHDNFLAAQKLGLTLTHVDNNNINDLSFDFDVIIDALIGVGGSSNIKGTAHEILKEADKSKSLKIAVDVPTGLDSETGIAGEYCFKADFTVTMFAIKQGMVINHGPDFCGEIHIAYLGAPIHIIKNTANQFILEHEDVKAHLPSRKRISSKFDYGKVVIIAGSSKYPGAAALTANSAITSGAGLVYLHTCTLHHSVKPEIIPVIYDSINGSISEDAYESILKAANNSNAVAIGPGLGDSDDTIKLIKKIINGISPTKKIIIDADGLKAIEKDNKLNKNIIITPHTGEFSRITNIDRKIIEEKSINLAIEWAKKLNCVILLKHVPVIITDGEKTFINNLGNPGMATGGSGDVLTGIIASLLGQGLSSLDAASVGAYIHSFAGDLYQKKYSQTSLTASKLIDTLDLVFHSLEKN